MNASEFSDCFFSRWQMFDSAHALDVDGQCVSYRQLLQQIAGMQERLREMGVSEGACVIVCCDHGLAQVVSCFALFSLGLCVVPLASETGLVRARLMIEDTCPSLCIADHDPAWLGSVPLLRWQPADEEAGLTMPDSVSSGTEALLLYSSGSTGIPKGVVIHYAQQMAICRHLAEAVGLRAGQRELLIAPTTHSDGWQRLLAVLYVGGCIYLRNGLLSIQHILGCMQEDRIQSLFLHPTLVRYVLKTNAERVRQAWQYCQSLETGSSSLLAEEVAALRDLLPADARLFVHYGITESPRSTMLHVEENVSLGSVGEPLPGVRLRLADEQGNTVAAGQTGEILLAGEHLAQRYWNRPGLYESRIRHGWLHTGDYGRLDAAGKLLFVGRRDDQIHSSGYSFYPAEVERELGQIPGVREFVCLGMDDPRGVIGQQVWLFVVPEQPEEWTNRQLFAHAKTRLEPWMMPRKIICVDDIPRTASGKPHRRRLMDMYKDNHA